MTTFEKIRNAALARLEAGEPPHIILQDYADFEDELRPVLERATGKSITRNHMKPKNKNKQQALNPLMMVVAVLTVIVIGLAAAVFGLNQVVIEPAQIDRVTTTETTCIGVPHAQITSQYALNRQNQQTNNTTVTTGSLVGAPVDSSTMTLAMTATPAPLSSAERSASGGGAAGIVATSVVTMDESPVMMPAEPEADGMGRADADVAMDVLYDAEESLEMAEESYADDDAAFSIAPPPSADRTAVNADPLRAGEIDDNAEWDTYQTYRQNFIDENGVRQIRDVDTTGRQIIRVVDEAGNPVLNACVQIFNGDEQITSSLTYATGMTLFFPNLREDTRYVDQFRVVVSKGSVFTETLLDREVVGGVTEIELAADRLSNDIQLDVMFLLDATGSMADEIAQLQGNILSISEQIDDLPSNVDVEYGLVAYRDRSDQYVTRTYDFTDSVAEFQDHLLTVEAGGGGDYPESLNEGFDMALNNVNWRSGDTIRLVFLVADAPPQLNYQDDADYSLLMQDALARGIKVHPIASGGLTPDGEFILRQIAQVTMGRFLFLTYEDGAIGVAGDERPDLEVGDPEDEQGIGDYSVNQLDELVLRLITDEIATLNTN